MVSSIRSFTLDFHSLTDKIVLRGNSSEEYLEYLQKARKNFELSLSLDNNYKLAHFNLANIYLDLGQIVKAKEHLSRARELNFSHNKCDILQSSILIEQGDYIEAKKILMKSKKSAESYFNRALVELNLGMNFEKYFIQFLELANNIFSLLED